MANSIFNIDLKKQTKVIQNKAHFITKNALAISEQIIDGSLSNGEKWQKVLAKTLKNSTILIGNQQEMALDSLEVLKKEYSKGAKRFKQLIDFKDFDMEETIPVKPVAKKISTATKKVTKKVTLKAKPVYVAKKTVETIKSELTSIKGINVKVEALLIAADITSIKQLATIDLKTLRSVVKSGGASISKLNPTPWRKEAKQILASK